MVLGGPKLQSVGLVTMPRANFKIKTHVEEETTFRLSETQRQFIEFLSRLRYCLTDVLPSQTPNPTVSSAQIAAKRGKLDSNTRSRSRGQNNRISYATLGLVSRYFGIHPF